MSDKISILIADDNEELTRLLSEYIGREEDIVVEGVANDGLQAVDMIISLKPDIVLLDIVMPGLDGIGVLERITAAKLEKKPIFLMLSAISQDMLVQKAVNLGAEYYIVKPFDMEVLKSRIRFIHSNRGMSIISNKRISYTATGESKKDPEMEIETEVINMLHSIGVPPHMIGYHYIKEAILQVLKNNREFMLITKVIYPEVAKKYNTTPDRVERAIRCAIENTWIKGNKKNIDKLFSATVSCNRGKPTNSEFIAMLADKIKLSIKKK